MLVACVLVFSQLNREVIERGGLHFPFPRNPGSLLKFTSLKSKENSPWGDCLPITNTQWRRGVLRLPAQFAKVDRSDGEGGLCEAIFLAWKSLAGAPSPIKHLYSLVPESDILGAASSCDLRLASFGLAFDGSETDTDLVRKVGGCLRALETEFSTYHLGSWRSDPNDWKVGKNAAHFIPLGRLGWRPTRDAAQDRRPFDQRGLLRVRLIPTIVDGATVRLERPDHLLSPASVNFGAILFPGAQFRSQETAKSFFIEGIDLPNGPGIIARACEDAHSQGCRVVVFPELTIDQGSRDLIQQCLRKKPWAKGAPAPSPHLVVAGSWHQFEGSARYNVATVFDGYGVQLFTQRKRLIFKDPEGRVEDIHPGNEFVVLIMGEALYAFGICLDFCNRCYDTAYGELDVDFVIVPSCGNATTMSSHIETAKDVDFRRKTRTFVVQQAYPDIRRAAGFVLNPDGQPGGKPPSKLKVAKPWTVFRV